MVELDELFDLESILQGTLGKKYKQCPRPFDELTQNAGLRGQGVDAVLSFERLWAHFIDDLMPIVGPGARAVVSGDWSNLTKTDLADMLGVWKVWTRYRQDLGTAAQRLNPFAQGGKGIDPRVSSAAQAQLRGYSAFQSAISVTEERDRKGAFARFKDWLSGKTSDLKQSIRDFDLDEWAESGWGQAAAGLAGAGMVAAMSYQGDVQGYQAGRELPPRERFRTWQEVEAQYAGAVRLDHPAGKSVSKLGYGTVIGHVPDGRVVLETTVSLWVVDPNDL
jgi:hypothetical protein